MALATPPATATSGPPRPTYLVLADDLEGQIRHLDPGARLPSEHDLVDAHGVSRLTARSALQELEARLLVRRVRGAGTFVARRIDYVVGPDMPPSATMQVLEAGATPGARVLAVEDDGAQDDVRRHLGVDPGGRVVSVTRLRTVDGLPAAHSTSHLRAELVGGLLARLEDSTSLHHVLSHHLGLAPRRSWARAELASPPAPVAELLGFEGRLLAWYLESCNVDATSGKVLELSQSWLRADSFRVRFELGPDHEPPARAGVERPR